MEAKNSDFRTLFNPRSIAIIGASARPESISGQFLTYLTRYGYKGSIYPINPRHKEIAGLSCYGSVSEVSGPVDVAICVVPNQAVEASVQECAAKGVSYLIIPSTGFAEASAEGERLQQRLLEIARSGGMRLLGPNCMGFLNFKDGVVASFGAFLEKPKDLKAGNIGFVSQSGAFGGRVVRRCLSRGLGLTYEISTGNEADIESLDLIEYLIEDPDTRVIGAFVESVKSGRRLVSLGWRARELGKPFVVLKAGRSARGLEAVSSHTGRLSSPARIYEGIFRQAGIIEVRTFSELCLALEAFGSLDKFPEKIGIAIVVGSGGNGVMMADQAADYGLVVSELTAQTQQRIATLIPQAGSCRNPVDVTAQVTHNEPDKLRQVVEILADEKDITCMIVGVNHRCLTQCWSGLLQTVQRKDKFLAITFPGDAPAEVEQGLRASRRALLVEEAEEVLWMLKVLRDYGQWEKPDSHGVPPGEWNQKDYIAPETPRSELTEADIKRLLAKYVPVPRGEVVHSSHEAVQVAARLGYPVVMKLVAAGLKHKTEAGAVRLNVGNPQEVVRAFEDLTSKSFSGKGAKEVLVEEMVQGGVEVILGFLRSKELGPVVMFGSGGTLVELVRDTTYRSLPLTKKDAQKMIEECLCSKLMSGFRNQPDKDIDALVEGILQSSKFFLANPWIKEMEFNPVAVLNRAEGIRILDALVVSEDDTTDHLRRL